MATKTGVTAEVALDKLEGMGSAVAIATHFRRRKLKGPLQNGYLCPVASYLRTETGASHVAVTPKRYRTGFNESFRALPAVVAEFIQNFDNGNYPTLVVKEDEKWQKQRKPKIRRTRSS